MAIQRINDDFQVLSPDTKLIAVRVTDIILDPNHPKFKDYGEYDSIGTVFYTNLNQSNPNTDSSARPIFSFIKNYPLINEIILITSSRDKDNTITSYYFPILNIWNHPHHNALPTLQDISLNDYNQSIVRQLEDGSTGINLGNYFKEKLNIKPLLPYEGDTIIEGRFGNSIRFGSTNISNKIGTPNGWSNIGELGDPITIIKNGQSQDLGEKGWVHAIEEISNDDSSIYMTSNQQLTNLKVASLNQKSFGANLIKVQTLTEQLDDAFITPPETPLQPNLNQESEEIINFGLLDEITLLDSQPPEPSVPNDPFADYASEILDGSGVEEVYGISGTEDSVEDIIEDIVDESEESIVSEEDLENISPILETNSITIPSRTYNTSVTLHPPETVYKLKDRIGLQNTSNRVEYLCIHTTAMAYGTTHEKVARFFMQSALNPNTGNNTGWSRHGYHTTIDYRGTCIQIYEDNEKSYGVGPSKTQGSISNQSPNIGNYNTININWIGGLVFDMTKPQANALNELIKFYVVRYPEIKVLGHNQIYNHPQNGRKDCPWIDVPTYCKKLGIPDNNIEISIPSGTNLSIYKTNSINVANLTNLKSA